MDRYLRADVEGLLMIGAIIGQFAAWLGTQLGKGRLTLSSIWTKVASFATLTWATVTIVAGWIYYCVTEAGNAIADIGPTILAIVIPSGVSGSAGSGLSSTILSWCAIANTLFPLAEAMGFLVGWLGLCVILSGYRLIKSWIPTLS
jgi:hypothetical protein